MICGLLPRAVCLSPLLWLGAHVTALVFEPVVGLALATGKPRWAAELHLVPGRCPPVIFMCFNERLAGGTMAMMSIAVRWYSTGRGWTRPGGADWALPAGVIIALELVCAVSPGGLASDAWGRIPGSKFVDRNDQRDGACRCGTVPLLPLPLALVAVVIVTVAGAVSGARVTVSAGAAAAAAFVVGIHVVVATIVVIQHHPSGHWSWLFQVGACGRELPL